MENRVTFHRFYGPRSCRVEARMTGGGRCRVLRIGDHVETVEVPDMRADRLWAAAEAWFDEWMEIVRPIVDRVFPKEEGGDGRKA